MQLLPFFSAVLGATISAILFHQLALHREKMLRRSETTRQLIEEFFSRDFIDHRIALWEMREAVLTNRASVTFIAAGYVYPIRDETYEGSRVNGLTEHEHLTFYLGYLSRLGFAIKRNEVEIETIVNALSYEFTWSADLIRAVAKSAESLAGQLNARCPTFVSHVKRVLSTLEIGPSTDEIDSIHFLPKEHEPSRFGKREQPRGR